MEIGLGGVIGILGWGIWGEWGMVFGLFVNGLECICIGGCIWILG